MAVIVTPRAPVMVSVPLPERCRTAQRIKVGTGLPESPRRWALMG